MNVIGERHDQITTASWLGRDPMPIRRIGTNP
jgi:hypothetical protein